MGKFYENLSDLNDLIKKIEKKEFLAEFIIECITKAKQNPDKKIHDIIKDAKKIWNK